MNKITKNNLDTIKACRYCPMCRQACPSEFINYKESDAPRGRAILMYNVYNGDKEFEASTIESVYNCFLCSACKSWCEGHELGGYDIPELMKFARRDIVSKGLAPKAVEEIKASLITNGNSWRIGNELSYTASVSEKKADVLYILGEGVNYKNNEVAEAFVSILKDCNIDFTLLKDEPTSGKELELLGYILDAKVKAQIMSERIEEMGCKIIIVSDPLVYDALKNDYPNWGYDLENVKILHVSEYLAGLLETGALSVKKSDARITLADSEFLGRNNNIYEAPRQVLKSIVGDKLTEMQWNREYLQSAGEAAFTFGEDAFNRGSELGQKISQKAIDVNAEVIITLSATAKNNISAATKLKVMDIAEFVKGQME